METGVLTPSRTRQLLKELDLRPKKKWGQNFLVDGNIVRKSLRLAKIEEGDTIVEIGPGLGTLTVALLEAGAIVHAVECDRKLCRHLGNSLGPENRGRFHLIHGDAVAFPLAGFDPPPAANPVPSFKVVANLPYAVAVPWLEKVLRGPLPERLVLMVQKEIADRLASPPGKKAFSPISILLQSAYEDRKGYKVSRRSFFPEPAVDSVLMRLVKKPNPFIFSEKAKSLMRRIFTQRRKQIRSIAKNQPLLSPWLENLEKNGISLASRPEALSLIAWQSLDQTLGNTIS